MAVKPWFTGAIAGLSLLAAACGSDDPDSAATTDAPAATAEAPPPSELSSLSRKGSKGYAPGSSTDTGKGIRMPLYEHVFLARQDVSAQQVEELTAQLKGVIEQMGGKVAKLEQWGVKSLSYRLRKNRKAHFTLLNIDAPPAVINEIERQERLNEDVLRYLTCASTSTRKARPR